MANIPHLVSSFTQTINSPAKNELYPKNSRVIESTRNSHFTSAPVYGLERRASNNQWHTEGVISLPCICECFNDIYVPLTTFFICETNARLTIACKPSRRVTPFRI